MTKTFLRRYGDTSSSKFLLCDTMGENQEVIDQIVNLASSSTTSIDDFTPPQVGWEIWTGSIVAVLPIVYASVLFKERIDTQRQCLVCSGSGLVSVTKSGTTLKNPRKCWNCGGLLPWLGWKRFWLSNLDIGNGGVLLYPDQDYEATNERIRKEQEQEKQENRDEMLRDNVDHCD